MNSQASYDLLSCISDFSVRINAHGVIQQASTSSQAFLQLPAELLQESIEFLIHPEDRSPFIEVLEKAKHSGEKQTFVCRLLRQRVLPVWVDCYVLQLPEDEYFIAAFDATHWKDNENQLVYLSTQVNKLTLDRRNAGITRHRNFPDS